MDDPSSSAFRIGSLLCLHCTRREEWRREHEFDSPTIKLSNKFLILRLRCSNTMQFILLAEKQVMNSLKKSSWHTSKLKEKVTNLEGEHNYGKPDTLQPVQ